MIEKVPRKTHDGKICWDKNELLNGIIIELKRNNITSPIVSYNNIILYDLIMKRGLGFKLRKINRYGLRIKSYIR